MDAMRNDLLRLRTPVLNSKPHTGDGPAQVESNSDKEEPVMAMDITAKVHRDPETSSSGTNVEKELEEQLSESTDRHIEGNDTAMDNGNPQGSGSLTTVIGPQVTHQQEHLNEAKMFSESKSDFEFKFRGNSFYYRE